MCGISGVYRIEKTTKDTVEKIAELFVAMEKEGHDAAGFYNGETIVKFPKTPSTLNAYYDLGLAVNIKEFFIGKNMVLCHNRAATRGSPTENKNNHPFETNRFVFAHNGVIATSNDKVVDESEPETDSYFFIRNVQQDVDNGTNVVDAIEKNIKDVNGSITFWMYDKNENCIYFFNDRERLYFVHTESEFWFASLSQYLKDIGFNEKDITMFAPDVLYKLELNNLNLVRLKEIVHGWYREYYGGYRKQLPKNVMGDDFNSVFNDIGRENEYIETQILTENEELDEIMCELGISLVWKSPLHIFFLFPKNSEKLLEEVGRQYGGVYELHVFGNIMSLGSLDYIDAAIEIFMDIIAFGEVTI